MNNNVPFDYKMKNNSKIEKLKNKLNNMIHKY